MNAHEHDRHAAFISHMPHIVSYSLTNSVLKQEDKNHIITLAAGGFRSMARLAKSNPAMWKDIFESNEKNLLDAIDAFSEELKLAKELSKTSTGRTLYILDEPTTGLHFSDINKLMNVIQKLVSMGNTVVIIEHNMDVIKSADYMIDLGPEGGLNGGNIITSGTPEEIVRSDKSYTGKYLKNYLL